MKRRFYKLGKGRANYSMEQYIVSSYCVIICHAYVLSYKQTTYCLFVDSQSPLECMSINRRKVGGKASFMDQME